MKKNKMMLAFVTFVFLGTDLAFAQHSCGRHTSDWHQHENDGYIQSWFKIVDWRPNYVSNETETMVEDEWLSLHKLFHANESCETDRIKFTTNSTFQHSVTTNWGGEIHADAVGTAKLWFWRCQGAVGAKVEWHRSGTSVNTEKIEVTIEHGVAKCRSERFYYEVRKMHQRIEFEYARARFRCKDFHKKKVGSWQLCENRKVEINGHGYISARSGWKFIELLCECDNGVPVPLEDK